jgi:hypothetical protein
MESMEEGAVSEVQGKKSPVLLILAAWLLVAVPAAWGLSYTVQNAMKLFAR